MTEMCPFCEPQHPCQKCKDRVHRKAALAANLPGIGTTNEAPARPSEFLKMVRGVLGTGAEDVARAEIVRHLLAKDAIGKALSAVMLEDAAVVYNISMPNRDAPQEEWETFFQKVREATDEETEAAISKQAQQGGLTNNPGPPALDVR